jgi:hypothetical protein
LDTKPDKLLAYKNDVVKLVLSVNNVKMIASVDMKHNYKFTVLALAIQKGDSKYVEIPVKNVSFYLVSTDLTKINQFKLDPLSYIRRYDSEAVEKYEKMRKK